MSGRAPNIQCPRFWPPPSDMKHPSKIMRSGAFRLTNGFISNFHRKSRMRYAGAMHWEKITLVGVGLLGGSLGLAIKQRGLAAKVDGHVRRSISIADCERLHVVDHATRDIKRAVENADLVILCTPLGQMREVTEKMLPALKKGAIVTDVGSVKASVVEELEAM